MNDQKAETPFVETEALLAALREDPDEVHRIVADMLPGERRAFDAAVDLLSRYTHPDSWCAVCGLWADHRSRDVLSAGPLGRLKTYHRGCYDSAGGRS